MGCRADQTRGSSGNQSNKTNLSLRSLELLPRVVGTSRITIYIYKYIYIYIFIYLFSYIYIYIFFFLYISVVIFGSRLRALRGALGISGHDELLFFALLSPLTETALMRAITGRRGREDLGGLLRPPPFLLSSGLRLGSKGAQNTY